MADNDYSITLAPIGLVRSPFQRATGTPLQPAFAKDTAATIEVFEPFVAGLKNLEGFERIWILFWCHRSAPASLVVTPYRDTAPHGVFATRAPARPNPIGLSAVRLLGIEGSTIRVAEVDILDGTPLLDIKPYISQFDSYADQRSGWLESASLRHDVVRADGRFERQLPG